MRTIPPEALAEFRTRYEKAVGHPVTLEQAEIKAHQLLALFRILLESPKAPHKRTS